MTNRSAGDVEVFAGLDVSALVTGGAQGDEILLAILTLPAPELDVIGC